jgi:hypothetical protein
MSILKTCLYKFFELWFDYIKAITPFKLRTTTMMVKFNFLADTLAAKAAEVDAEVIWGPWKTAHPSEDIVVSHIIYSKVGLAVLECSIGCNKKFAMKARTPYSSLKTESDKYMQMIDDHPLHNRGPASLFPKVYSLVKLPMPNNDVWGGMCMDLVEHSVISLLYPHALASEDAEENQRVLADLTSKFFKRPITSDVDMDEEELGGVFLKRVEKRNLQTSLVAACMELLHRFHGFGWVHGDSHLGNFVLNSKTWRVYAIDLERSFKINGEGCEVQQLLDIQELVGHASGAIVSYPNGQSWDLHNILGVAVKLNPLLRRKKHLMDIMVNGVFHLLPVCSCFAYETKEEKMPGCLCCNSAKNNTVAKMFKEKGLDFVDDFLKMSLKALRIYVKAARDVCIHESVEMEASLLSCGVDLASYLKNERFDVNRHFDIECIKECAEDKENYGAWVRQVLYFGSFMASWKFKGDKLAAHLRQRGHPKVAHQLLIALSG